MYTDIEAISTLTMRLQLWDQYYDFANIFTEKYWHFKIKILRVLHKTIHNIEPRSRSYDF
jgi:hypothetical protein